VKTCNTCTHRYTGPMSGMPYCTQANRFEFAHQLRQERAPCGRDGLLHEPEKNTETREAA